MCVQRVTCTTCWPIDDITGGLQNKKDALMSSIKSSRLTEPLDRRHGKRAEALIQS